MQANAVAYQNAYDSFLAFAADPQRNKIGKYAANPRTIDVMTPVQFLAAEAVANNVTKPLFSPVDTYKNRKTMNTLAPNFGENGQVPNNSIFGIYAAFALYDHEVGTATQALNARRIFSSSIIRLDVTGQYKLNWHASRMLNSFAAYTMSSDGQAAPASAKSKILNVDFTELPAPAILTPGSKLGGEITFDVAVTFGVEMVLIAAFHCFAVDAGEN